MSRLRRYDPAGRPVFVTNVTYDRRPILSDHAASLSESIDRSGSQVYFQLFAWVILPDHFHLIINPESSSVPEMMKRIKNSFSARHLKKTSIRKGRVWQLRFWDHIIRDQPDMNKQVDYIHHNPVKHGLVSRPFDYRYSSVHMYRDSYPDGWGVRNFAGIEVNFGE